MQRVSSGRSYLDPRLVNSFLDSCAFDPKYAPEDEAARQIRKLGNRDVVSLLLAHSNQQEIDHPHTPEDVKIEAQKMIYTIEIALTPDERKRKAEIHTILTGNGKPEKYKADATHVFEVGKYGGYFITTDERILGKWQELSRVCDAVIFKPSEWLRVFHDGVYAKTAENFVLL
jgi:hypothetical protein